MLKYHKKLNVLTGEALNEIDDEIDSSDPAEYVVEAKMIWSYLITKTKFV